VTQAIPTPSCSPLAQSVTRDGKTVQIDIYENGEATVFDVKRFLVAKGCCF
jgi:hypothetical protein